MVWSEWILRCHLTHAFVLSFSTANKLARGFTLFCMKSSDLFKMRIIWTKLFEGIILWKYTSCWLFWGENELVSFTTCTKSVCIIPINYYKSVNWMASSIDCHCFDLFFLFKFEIGVFFEVSKYGRKQLKMVYF